MSAPPISSLVADDHAVLRAGLRMLLEAQSDMVVVDAQYGKEDVVQKVTWGHSYIGDFVELFRDLDIARLCLFHYEPSYPDEVLERLIDEAKRKVAAMDPKPKFEVAGAYEGLRIEL